MNTKPAEVSAFEAKTRLSELLRETEAGRSFVIRRRGKAVARLIPAVQESRARDCTARGIVPRDLRTSHGDRGGP